MSGRAHRGGGHGYGFRLGSSSDESGEQLQQQQQEEGGGRPPHPQAMGASTAGDGYVIQVPRDQIFRMPPPENAHRYKRYTRRAEMKKKKGRRFCFCLSCRCISITLAFLFVLLLLAAITGGALYLVYRPTLPSFDVESLTFSPGNLSTLLVLAQNPNSKLGLAYKGGGTVRAVFYGMEVGSAEWPEFRLGAGEARGVSAMLEGGPPGVVGRTIAEGERVGSVVGKVEIRVPAGLQVDDLQVPLTVKGTCDVKVTPRGKVMNSTCHVKLKLPS